MAPQLIHLALVAIGLLVAANQHGKNRLAPNSFWTALVGAAIGCGVLYWGGFYAPLGWGP